MRVFGALGCNSIVWSQTVHFGKHWDCCSLKTFMCQWNSCGTFIRSASEGWSGWIVIWHKKYFSFHIGWGMFWILGMKIAFCAFEAQIIMKSCPWSIHPLFQSILSYVAMNHRYPRITLCSPKLDRKNLLCFAQFRHLDLCSILVCCFCFPFHRHLVLVLVVKVVWWGVEAIWHRIGSWSSLLLLSLGALGIWPFLWSSECRIILL